ncbi:hypothetical protein AC579_8243 [Pseudocercospora musae]|uniref:Uncharacterized protein n=1 Tax=Pseudocercospora musae TaxID=113226 RepID=A0A139IVU2_9PEZI|nr:hypothetical protein AC579_8243 [Pseudocercospora musae]
MQGFTDMPQNGKLVVLNSLKEAVTLRSDLCRAEGGVDKDRRVYCKLQKSIASSEKRNVLRRPFSQAFDNGQHDEDQDDEEFIPKRVKCEDADVTIKQESSAALSSVSTYTTRQKEVRIANQELNGNGPSFEKFEEIKTELNEESQQPIVGNAQGPGRNPWLMSFSRK